MSRSKIPSRKFNKSEFFKNLQRSDLQGHIYRSEVKNKQRKHKPSNMCVCHSTQQKTCSGLHQFPVVEDSFIDQDEQNLSLIVLATDISKDIRRTEQTYNLRQERKGACALVQSSKYLETSAVPRNVQPRHILAKRITCPNDTSLASHATWHSSYVSHSHE